MCGNEHPRRAGVARPDRAEHRPGRAAARPRRRRAHPLCRVRPHRPEPARGQPHAAAHTAPVPAGRRAADRPRRRGHRHDRRSARCRGAGAQQRRHGRATGPTGSAASSNGSSTSTTAPTGALVVNNLDWTGEQTTLEFLRDVGKHFSINVMLQRETVKRRLEGDGMSYTEFSYLLLQSQDYLHLHRTLRLPAADRRVRPVGQHRRRGRPDPEGRGRGGARPHHAAGHRRGRPQDRQVHRRRQHLARPGDDLAVRLVPVLRQRRRRRRDPVPAVLHVPGAGGDRRAAAGRRRTATCARGAAQAGRGAHHAGAREAGHRAGGRRELRAVRPRRSAGAGRRHARRGAGRGAARRGIDRRTARRSSTSCSRPGSQRAGAPRGARSARAGRT